MIKGISQISNLAKAGVAGALLVGSVLANASKPMKDFNTRTNQTEVISKAGAEAIKSMSVQEISQSSVSTAPNPRLNRMFRKFAENEEFKKAIDSYLSNVYKKHGTVMGGAYIQHQIDRQILGALLTENTDILIKNNINPKLGEKVKSFGPVFYNSVRENKDKIFKWMEESYTPGMQGLLASDHKLSGKEAIKKLDYIAEKEANFNLDELIDYHVSCDNFKRNHIHNKTDDQSLSDLAAYKMFMIDKLMIKGSLQNSGFFGKSSVINKYESLIDYYDKWMNSVEPKEK